jgi:hypothetical protein
MMRDNAIIRRIKDREQQINKISSAMIAGIQKDSLKMIDTLSKELGELRDLLSNREFRAGNGNKSGLNQKGPPAGKQKPGTVTDLSLRKRRIVK